VNRNNFKHFIAQVLAFPYWMKAALSWELNKNIDQNDDIAIVYTSYKPVLTFKGSDELRTGNAGFDTNIHNILELSAKDYSIAEISLDTYLTLEEVSSYFLMCIKEGYLENPGNQSVLLTAMYLSGKYKTGEFLTKCKKITDEQLLTAINVDINSKNNRKFGEILCDLGYISKCGITSVLELKQEAKKRFVLDYNEVPKSDTDFAKMSDKYKQKIEELQTENRKLKTKLNKLLTMVKTNDY